MNKKERPLDRRSLLKGMGALAGLSAASAVLKPAWLYSTAFGETAGEGTPLRVKAAKKGLLYGASAGCGDLSGDSEYAAHFTKECGILVPETDLKWDILRPEPGIFYFTRGDRLARFAKENNMFFRGHTLVWHEALPWWFQHTVNNKNAGRMLRKHIETVVGHYAGQIHSWDVVNEAIAPWDGLPGGLRNSPWLRLLGPGYIDLAFRTAAAADPKAMLVYNQDHLEYDSKLNEECRTATLELLRRLKSSGAPVHALGVQGHLRDTEGRFDSAVFRKFLHDAAGLDLKILITELDALDQDLPRAIGQRDRLVAKMYEEFLTAALSEPAVTEVLTWGLSDKYSWLKWDSPRKDGAPVRPLPLDEKFNRKPAWRSIALAFDKAQNKTL